MSINQTRLRMIKVFTGIIFLATCVLTNAQDHQTTLDSLITHNTKYINVQGSQFSGDGWEELVKKSREAKYVLVGEDHGYAEIPYLTSVLASEIPFTVFVSEIDGITASILKEVTLLSEEEQSAFHKKNASSLSFYSAQEEYELAKSISEQGAEFWGLDQVSLFSTGLVYKEMAKQSTNPDTKAILLKAAKFSDSLFSEAVRTGNYEKIYIFNQTKGHFLQIEEHIKDEGPLVKEKYAKIYDSWKIYNGIDGANHNTRIGSMKRTLLDYYLEHREKKKEGDRFLFKFGANHVTRGESLTRSYDIGNLVQNLAHAEGALSFHIMIIGKQGRVNTFLPAEGMSTRPFDISDNKNLLHYLKPFYKNIGSESWAYFDLTPIRKLLNAGKISLKDQWLTKTIKGYDALIIIPQLTASTIIGQ